MGVRVQETRGEVGKKREGENDMQKKKKKTLNRKNKKERYGFLTQHQQKRKQQQQQTSGSFNKPRCHTFKRELLATCVTLIGGCMDPEISQSWRINIAPRAGRKHISTTRLPFKEQRKSVEPAAKTPALVLLMILSRLKTHMFRKLQKYIIKIDSEKKQTSKWD